VARLFRDQFQNEEAEIAMIQRAAAATATARASPLPASESASTSSLAHAPSLPVIAAANTVFALVDKDVHAGTAI
jgi:hypothetical protein